MQFGISVNEDSCILDGVLGKVTITCRLLQIVSAAIQVAVAISLGVGILLHRHVECSYEICVIGCSCTKELTGISCCVLVVDDARKQRLSAVSEVESCGIYLSWR